MRSDPDGRLLLLGATGATGRLAAAAMVRQGLEPVLLGRDGSALRDLAEELRAAAGRPCGLSVEVVDVTEPQAVRDQLHSTGDVLVSCVGPFTELGDPAVAAAADAGCGYLDCSWEPPFLHRVFTQYADTARETGAVLLPAFGYHDVAGSLAATIAVRRTMTTRPPARVDIGYFVIGGRRGAPPNVLLLEESFRWIDGALKQDRPGSSVRSFEVAPERSLDALSLGSAEHFTVPRLAATISEVNVYVGWYGRLSRAAALAGALTGTANKLPGVGGLWGSVVKGVSTTSPLVGGDDRGQRSVAVAETFNADGAFEHRVRVVGPPPRELTAGLLAWGAGMLLRGNPPAAGALGPAEAFGTEALIGGCMALGLAKAYH